MAPYNPYNNKALDRIYELLFCDEPEMYRSADSSPNAYPWDTVFSESPSRDELIKIIDDWELETRPKIFASGVLRSLGNVIDGKRLFGVIVEVGLENGLDVLAAYEDGTSRYINHSGKLIVWETQTEKSNVIIVDLFLAARKVVDKIGPWEGDRLPPPSDGNARISFLVSDGLNFGEGPFAALSDDPSGGPVIRNAFRLMQFLIENSVSE